MTEEKKGPSVMNQQPLILINYKGKPIILAIGVAIG